jgi:2-haloacid dehalogenase
MPLTDQDNQITIIFDIGGVLLDWNPRYLYNKIFDNDESRINHFLQVICPQEWNAKQDAGYPIAKAVEERVELYPDFEPQIRAYYGRWEEMLMGEIKGSVKILSDLRQVGYPLCALSNWSAETYQRVKNKYEFFQWFDEILISGSVKVIKPDQAIFELLLDRIQRPADQCLLIDDSEQNLVVAEQLGFQTIQFSSPERLLTDLHQRNIL